MDQSNHTVDVQQLTRRLHSGDETALEEIINKFCSRLSTFLKSRFSSVLTEADIDDILSETFMRLWLNRERFDSKGVSVLSWCYVVARNMAFDIVRRKSRERQHLESLWQELNARRTEEDKYEVSPSDLALVAQSIRALSIDEQEVLWASVRSGTTGWAVALASKLHADPGTIRQRRMRALEKVRREFERLRTQP